MANHTGPIQHNTKLPAHLHKRTLLNPRGLNIKPHEVRLDILTQPPPSLHPLLAHPPRQPMHATQQRILDLRAGAEMLKERFPCRGREDPALPHAAADGLASAPHLPHQAAIAEHYGAHGRAQVLAEINRDEVDERAVFLQRARAGRDGFEEPGAVEMRLDPVGVGPVADPAEFVQGEDGAAGGVLHGDDAGGAFVDVVCEDGVVL